MSASTITKYHGACTPASGADSQRVAVDGGGTLCYLLSDQLGSTSITTNSCGAKVAELRYKVWGEVRFTSGASPTKYTYTGQYSNVADFGLIAWDAG